MNHGLSKEQLKLIKSVFDRFLLQGQKIKIWLYGSRARGDHRPYSDIDLLVESHPPLSAHQKQQLLDAFEESDLTLKVDVVPSEELADTFKDRVNREKVELFQ